MVLVVLRGWPGYQCPLCTKQVGELIGKADELKKAGAQVLFVYPGPADKLKEKADEFVKGKDYPAHFTCSSTRTTRSPTLTTCGGARRTRPRTPRRSSSTASAR